MNENNQTQRINGIKIKYGMETDQAAWEIHQQVTHRLTRAADDYEKSCREMYRRELLEDPKMAEIKAAQLELDNQEVA